MDKHNPNHRQSSAVPRQGDPKEQHGIDDDVKGWDVVANKRHASQKKSSYRGMPQQQPPPAPTPQSQVARSKAQRRKQPEGMPRPQSHPNRAVTHSQRGHHAPTSPRPSARPPQQRQPGRKREWTRVEQERQAPPPQLFTEVENEAQKMWRKQQPPVQFVSIPTNIALQDRTFEDIANDLGTYLHSMERASNPGRLRFGVWGERSNVEATIQRIEKWIADMTPSKNSSGSSKFNKIYSLTPPRLARNEKRFAREVKRHRYRQYPPFDLAFGAIGSFHWPSDQYQPDKALGTSYQALDQIRMDTSCYIVFNKDRSLFQAMGAVGDVRKALSRLRGTVFQLTAKQVLPTRLYVLNHADATSMPTHVYLETYHHPRVIASGKDDKIGTSFSPRGQGIQAESSRVDQTNSITQTNLGTVRQAIHTALRGLHYYKGHVRLNIRLGTFILNSYIPPEDGLYDLKEYTDMLRASLFRGQVTEEISTVAKTPNLLTRLWTAGDFLAVQDLHTAKLADIKPTYSATFVFEEETTDLQLTMSWIEPDSTDGHRSRLEPADKRWTRTDRQSGLVSTRTAVSLTNLHTGRAWQMELVASQDVDVSRLPAALATFPDRVQINPAALQRPALEEPFLKHLAHPKLKSVRQARHFRHALVDSDYTLQVSQLQDRRFAVRRSLLEPAPVPAIVVEPCWGLSVFRADWAAMLATNERLPVGLAAEWDAGVPNWFPADMGPDAPGDGDGFGQLMDKLRRIERLVGEAGK